MIRVTVWNEYNGTQNFPHYPKGLHEYIKDFLNEREGITATSQIQFCEGEGLTEEILSATDVLGARLSRAAFRSRRKPRRQPCAAGHGRRVSPFRAYV